MGNNIASKNRRSGGERLAILYSMRIVWESNSIPPPNRSALYQYGITLCLWFAVEDCYALMMV